MATAYYSRVSSKSQDTAAQDRELKAHASARDGEVLWFRDKFTGTTMERPGFAKLMDAVNSGKVDTVVIWRLDRLGRTAKGLTALFEELKARRVNLISMKDGVDLSTPAGTLVANVLASVAQFETEVRKERQAAGIAAAKERGVRFGPEPGKYKGRRVKVTEEQAAQVLRLKAEGTKVAAIARATGLSRPTIYSLLGETANA